MSGNAGGVLGRLDDLLGPMADDQAPIVLEQEDRLVDYAEDKPEGGHAHYIGFDADDNLFAAGVYIEKFDASGERKWRIDSSEYLSVSDTHRYAVSPSGSLIIGTATTGVGASIVKLGSDGSPEWTRTFSTSSLLSIAGFEFTADGAFIAVGLAQGQVEGNPSSASGGPWAARYEADGTRTWLKQYDAEPSWVSRDEAEIMVTASDTIVVAWLSALQTISSDGDELTRATYEWSLSPGKLNSYGTAKFAKKDDAIYAWTYFSHGSSGERTGSSPALAKVGLNNEILWYRVAEAPRQAVIDDVENVIWTGDFRSGSYVTALGDDVIFVTGLYTNSYMNGSVPKPSREDAFVACYRLNGDRVWFQEYRARDPANDTVGGLDQPLDIILDQDGNPVVSFRLQAIRNTDYVVRLSAEDGTVLR